MRFVVVGGDVVALLTAVECVSAGHEVVVVDQADIPFSGTTSFDRHRIVRALHGDNVGTTAAAAREQHRWRELEHVLCTSFYEEIGALTVLPSDEVRTARAVVADAGVQAHVLDRSDLAVRYPHITFPPGASAVLEPRAGVLHVDRVVNACAGWLRWHDRADVHPHRTVVEIDAERTAVRVAGGEVIHADAVLVAVSPWSRDLLVPRFAHDLVLHRHSMIYCDVPGPDAAAWARTPAVVSLGPEGDVWLVPPVTGTPLKLGAASACRSVPRVGDNSTPSHWRHHLLDVSAAVLPGFRADWLVDTRDCYHLGRGPVFSAVGNHVLTYTACGDSWLTSAPSTARALARSMTTVDRRSPVA